MIYITHGFKGPDIPPFDESDGKDEYLATYWGFEYPFTCIWDDELNFLLNKLDSKGIAVIIDSCHSGGFSDTAKWIKGFAEDIERKGRVILMSCGEDELSYGSYFTDYIIEGLEGDDFNNDGMCSAEEAFEYAKPKILELAKQWNIEWHPQIYDDYEGELNLTIVYEKIDQQQTEVAIRDNLSKNDLTRVTRYMKGESDEGWIDFDFRDIDVIREELLYSV